MILVLVKSALKYWFLSVKLRFFSIKTQFLSSKSMYKSNNLALNTNLAVNQ